MKDFLRAVLYAFFPFLESKLVIPETGMTLPTSDGGAIDYYDRELYLEHKKRHEDGECLLKIWDEE